MNLDLQKSLVGLAITIAVGSFCWAWRANTQMALMEQRLESIAADKELDKRITKAELSQVENGKRFWKSLTWTYSQVNSLRHKAGLDEAEWPKVD